VFSLFLFPSFVCIILFCLHFHCLLYPFSFCHRILGVKYPEVCNYQSLGESLMPGGEVDNFLIPCFCCMFFKEKHPASSGRRYFFPHVGVGTSLFSILCVSDFFDYVVIYKFSVYAFSFCLF
jgi:hypothetical protein